MGFVEVVAVYQSFQPEYIVRHVAYCIKREVKSYTRDGGKPAWKHMENNVGAVVKQIRNIFNSIMLRMTGPNIEESWHPGGKGVCIDGHFKINFLLDCNFSVQTVIKQNLCTAVVQNWIM